MAHNGQSAIGAVIFSSILAAIVGLTGLFAFDFTLLAAFGTYVGLSIGMTLYLVLVHMNHTPDSPELIRSGVKRA